MAASANPRKSVRKKSGEKKIGPKARKSKSVSPKKLQPGEPSNAIHAVAEAVESLRRGEPVAISAKDGIVLAHGVETMRPKTLAALQKKRGAQARLVLSHARARTLKIRLYTADVVALAVGPRDTLAKLQNIADPTSDMADPMKGPFEALREKRRSGEAAAVKLAKLAGLLPAVIVCDVAKVSRSTQQIAASQIRAYETEAAMALCMVARARVPLAGAEKTEIAAFRSGDAAPEHYAIIINAPRPHDSVLTRLHSECFTGDLLGSLKCDCGSQLRGAIEAIEKAGGGVLLYLAQEGRGIGLINKLRAYRLQDQGFDTMQANERLGFADDERLYGVAAQMLTLLGYKKIRLMTNNPLKVAALKDAGVQVTKRVRHAFPSNVHNRAYLQAKVEKAGHLF